MSETLHFDPIAHEYRWGDRVLHGVTDILTATGIVSYAHVPPDVLEHAKMRGLAVHAAIHARAIGEAPVLDDETIPYVMAWDRFVRETGYVSTHVERPLADPTLGFAGTPDDVGLLGGLATVVDRKAVAQVQGSTAVQLAAYRWLCKVNCIAAVRRIAVQLRPDGTFRQIEYRDPVDEQEFRAALLLVQRRTARNGRSLR
jgi:hypothetical protein